MPTNKFRNLIEFDPTNETLDEQYFQIRALERCIPELEEHCSALHAQVAKFEQAFSEKHEINPAVFQTILDSIKRISEIKAEAVKQCIDAIHQFQQAHPAPDDETDETEEDAEAREKRSEAYIKTIMERAPQLTKEHNQLVKGSVR